jgi:cytochrome P450
VSFGGGGPHFCLGAFLARMEIRVLLEEMARRDITVQQTGPEVRVASNFVHGVASVPMTVVR